MSEFRSLIVVGSIGSGKSTAVEHLRGSAYTKSVVVPLRWSTRPYREGIDNTLENMYMNRESLEEGIALQQIFPHWQRQTDIGQKPDIYGFVPPPDDDERLVVYSANNYVLTDNNPSVLEVMERALIVVVNASKAVRRQRLIRRLGSSGLADELLARCAKVDDLIRLGDQPMITIDTSISPNPHHGQQQMTRLLEEEFGIVPEPGLVFGPSDDVDSDSSSAK